MSEFENLEKWLVDNDKTKLNEWRSHMVKEAFIGGWQAATAEANKRISELEGEVAKAKEYASMCNSETINIGQFYDHALLENKQLQAHINVLREALRLENFAADSWANAFYNAFQYIKNLRDGISNFDFAIANLDLCEKDCQFNWNKADAKTTLSSTPAHHINDDVRIFSKDSLVQHDSEVIERVVTLLKDSAWDDGIIDMRVNDLIEDVRKLKGTA